MDFSGVSTVLAKLERPRFYDQMKLFAAINEALQATRGCDKLVANGSHHLSSGCDKF